MIATEWEQFRALDLDRLRLRHGAAGDRRSAQHLSRRGNEAREFPLPRRRAPRRRATLRSCNAAAPQDGERKVRPAKNSPRRRKRRQHRLTVTLPQSGQFYLIAKIYFAKFERYYRVVCRQGYGLRYIETRYSGYCRDQILDQLLRGNALYVRGAGGHFGAVDAFRVRRSKCCCRSGPHDQRESRCVCRRPGSRRTGAGGGAWNLRGCRASLSAVAASRACQQRKTASNDGLSRIASLHGVILAFSAD